MEFKNISVRKVKDIFVAEATTEVKVINTVVIRKEDLEQRNSVLAAEIAENQKLIDAITVAEVADAEANNNEVVPE